MDIDKLLELPWQELQKMTDAEVIAFYAPKFDVIRPEFAAKKASTNTVHTNTSKQSTPSKPKELTAKQKLEEKISQKDPALQALIRGLI